MAGLALSRRRWIARWRAAFLGFERNVYLLLLFTLGKGFQLSIGALSINLYVHSLGYSLSFIGLVAAMPAIGSLVSAVPSGILADRWGRKPLLILSGILNPLALAAIGLSTSAPMLIAASLANGLLSSAYWVINIPMLTESTREEQRVWVLSLNNFLLLGVGAFGSLIGGVVPELVSHLLGVSALSTTALRWGVLAAAIVVFLPALPLVFLTESRRPSPSATPTTVVPTTVVPTTVVPTTVVPTTVMPTTVMPIAPAEGPPAGLAPLPASLPVSVSHGTSAGLPLGAASIHVRRQRAYKLVTRGIHLKPGAIRRLLRLPAPQWATTLLFFKLLAPDALYSTGEGAAIGLLQIFFLLRFGLQPGALGAFYTSAGLLSGATSLIAARIVRRWGKLRTATTMQLLSVPAVLGIGFGPSFPIAATAEYARNFLRGIFEPVYAAFAMEQVPSSQRATLSGFYSVTWSIGYSIGPALAGWLQQHVGLSAAYVVSAVCIASAALLLRFFFGGARPKAPGSP
jgi:MFS family permease